MNHQEKPGRFPISQINGAPLKSLTQILLDRRATSHFKPDPVPEKHLQAILEFAAQAPSGYNLQPWRFLVVRDAANRKRLQQAAFGQEKISEAPVVVIAFAIKDEWKRDIDEIFREGIKRGFGKADMVDAIKKQATGFIDSFSPPVWLNRHVMIAFTVMMLMAEAYGLDTAPMEGFDSEAVKREFGLPAAAEVVALLAIGFAKEPDKAYAGRLPMEKLFFHEKYTGSSTA